MYKQTKHQKGSALAVFAIVVTVALIGALGWIGWQNFISKQPRTTTMTTAQKSPQKSADTSTQTDVKSYTTTDEVHGQVYVKSFDYRSNWRSVDVIGEGCAKFNFCASPPLIILADKDDNAKVTFYGPQSASDVSIDEQALSLAKDGYAGDKDGKIATGFNDLDGLHARKIEYNNGNVLIVISIRGGFGTINFNQVNNTDMELVLSTWKWQ